MGGKPPRFLIGGKTSFYKRAKQHYCQHCMTKQDRTLLGMGTTLVAACFLSDSLLIGNVGDSRAYFLRDGDCGQGTQDHSYAAERLREGWVSANGELPARLQQIITRALEMAAWSRSTGVIAKILTVHLVQFLPGPSKIEDE